jgi:hypothetical protein
MTPTTVPALSNSTDHEVYGVCPGRGLTYSHASPPYAPRPTRSGSPSRSRTNCADFPCVSHLRSLKKSAGSRSAFQRADISQISACCREATSGMRARSMPQPIAAAHRDAAARSRSFTCHLRTLRYAGTTNVTSFPVGRVTISGPAVGTSVPPESNAHEAPRQASYAESENVTPPGAHAPRCLDASTATGSAGHIRCACNFRYSRAGITGGRRHGRQRERSGSARGEPGSSVPRAGSLRR